MRFKGCTYGLVSWIDDLNGLLLLSLNPLVVDEQRSWLVVLARVRGVEIDDSHYVRYFRDMGYMERKGIEYEKGRE